MCLIPIGDRQESNGLCTDYIQSIGWLVSTIIKSYLIAIDSANNYMRLKTYFLECILLVTYFM